MGGYRSIACCFNSRSRLQVDLGSIRGARHSNRGTDIKIIIPGGIVAHIGCTLLFSRSLYIIPRCLLGSTVKGSDKITQGIRTFTNLTRVQHPIQSCIFHINVVISADIIFIQGMVSSNIHCSTIQMGIIIDCGIAFAAYHINSYINCSIAEVLHGHSAGHRVNTSSIYRQLFRSSDAGIVIFRTDIDFCLRILHGHAHAHSDHGGLIGVFFPRIGHLVHLGCFYRNATAVRILRYSPHCDILVTLHNTIHIHNGLAGAILVDKTTHKILCHILIRTGNFRLQANGHHVFGHTCSANINITAIACSIIHKLCCMNISVRTYINRSICFAQIKGHINLIDYFIENIHLAINLARIIQRIPKHGGQISFDIEFKKACNVIN